MLSLPCLLPVVASADIPEFPHIFRGTVTINNQPAPNGTLVSAAITGRTVKTSDQNPVATVNGNYGIDGLSLLVQGDDLVEGDIITFYVNGVSSGVTRTYQPGGGPTWANLSVTITTPPGPGGPGGDGGIVEPDENIPPVARAGGPYQGYVGFSIAFSGAASYDPDGTIVGYRWDYTGDGSWDTDWLTNPTTSHIYEEAGNYSLRLQVKDNANATDIDTTTVTVLPVVTYTASNETLAYILEQYGLDLTEPFQAIDTTGDGKVDTFIDPNNLIYLVRKATVEGDVIFLLSTQDGDMPDFFWNPETDEIVPITAIEAELSEPIVDTDEQQITFEITVEKADWIYIKIIDSYPLDEYPGFTLTVTTSDGRVISSDMIWREDGFIYVLDDPDVQYLLIYGYDQLPADLVPPEPEPEPEVGIPLWIPIIGLVALIIIIIVALLFKTGYLYVEDKNKKKPGKK